MCGRARLSSDVSEIKIRFAIPSTRPAPNFAPGWKWRQPIRCRSCSLTQLRDRHHGADAQDDRKREAPHLGCYWAPDAALPGR
jgi:hypothetical protein